MAAPKSSTTTKIVTKIGEGKLGAEQKTRDWIEILCSRSSGGCGTVFWAEDSEFTSWHDDDERTGRTYMGQFTQCPTCNKSVGGLDLKFIRMQEPPGGKFTIDGRALCITCKTHFQSLECGACAGSGGPRPLLISSRAPF